MWPRSFGSSVALTYKRTRKGAEILRIFPRLSECRLFCLSLSVCVTRPLALSWGRSKASRRQARNQYALKTMHWRPEITGAQHSDGASVSLMNLLGSLSLLNSNATRVFIHMDELDVKGSLPSKYTSEGNVEQSRGQISKMTHHRTSRCLINCMDPLLLFFALFHRNSSTVHRDFQGNGLRTECFLYAIRRYI